MERHYRPFWAGSLGALGLAVSLFLVRPGLAQNAADGSWEKKARAEYDRLSQQGKADLPYAQFAELIRKDSQRLSALKSNPNLRYTPAAGSMTACGNGDFETGLDATQWQGAYGKVPASGDPDFSTFTTGIVGGALNDPDAHATLVGPGTDSTVGIPLAAPGSSRSVRIGNAANGGRF